MDMMTVLIFLDDVTMENGPLQLVPGSHKGLSILSGGMGVSPAQYQMMLRLMHLPGRWPVPDGQGMPA